MDNDFIVTKMQGYIHRAAQELSAWLSDLLPKASDDWWNECVLDKLSYAQREIAKEKGFSKLTEFDLAALLRIADKSWYEMRNVAYLPTKERECIRDMMRVRNNWAHLSASIPGKDMIIDDLKTLYQFFEQMYCDNSFLSEIESFTKAVEKPDSIIFEREPVQQEAPSQTIEQPASAANEIKEKSLVYLVGEPEKRGIVFSVTNLGQTVKYELFIDGGISTYYSGQIALVEESAGYKWVDADTFRSYLTAYQINNPSARNLYSLNSARIDFVPYQFRPALKMIHANEPRILIADSVGVGKTIEAGLIIKELEARSDLENILIICPKPLVAERKWELEMKRFDEEFVPLDGSTLRQVLSDTDRDGEWPARFSKAIIPYSVLDSRIYNGDDRKKSRSFGLDELDPAPHFDLVIVDEAHHIRNGSMEKEKAFAYKCVKYFCDHADAVVMLTATPLQTSDDDLFTLMNVLRPDVIIDKATFNMMTRPNEYISQCSHIIRAAGENWQEEAREQLQNVLRTQWGENVIANNPVYEDVLQRLQLENLSRDDRVSLISAVESLHSFNTMLNRTRRKDIQDFCVRRSHTLETEFTEEQRTLHDELLQFEYAALSTLHNARSIPFMMSTIRRQAASCIFGLAPYIRDIINRRFVQMNDDPDIDFDLEELDGGDAGTFSGMAKHILDLADNLPEDDPKFDSLLEIINQKQTYENNKIILFSTFRHTLAYLRKKLLALGLRVDQIDGSVKDDKRLELRQHFELPKENPDAIDILLFTEVGSEGLDYQFCDMMINYDLPWNPMKIEQRIGRIDRRGQKSEVVNIYNVITADTVDADIYYRCLMRIGIFEKSIGECEEILGEIGSQIEKLAVDTALTEDERRRKLEQIADNEVRKMQELSKLEDEEKELFGFDLSNYTTSKEIQKAESPWLTSLSIQKLVEKYLNDRLGLGSYIIGESDLKTLRLNASARYELRSDFAKLPGVRNAVRRSWEIYLKGGDPTHAITFDADAAEKNRNAFFITSMHPLARQAASYYATNETAYISLDYASDTLTPGKYPFSVYAWNYMGLNPHFRLVTVCENDAVSDELVDILQNTQTAARSASADKSTWQNLEGKHVQMWMAGKDSYLQDVKVTATFKLESLHNSFVSRKRTLEQQIHDAVDPAIIRMRQSELESATETYEKKAQKIQEQASRADIHITLIANGIITIS
jgi:ATP-dependent helicase HepA